MNQPIIDYDANQGSMNQPIIDYNASQGSMNRPYIDYNIDHLNNNNDIIRSSNLPYVDNKIQHLYNQSIVHPCVNDTHIIPSDVYKLQNNSARLSLTKTSNISPPIFISNILLAE